MLIDVFKKGTVEEKNLTLNSMGFLYAFKTGASLFIK